MTYELPPDTPTPTDQDDPGMDAPRRRTWEHIRHAIQDVIHRWHPEGYPPPNTDPSRSDPVVVEIYNLIDICLDADLIARKLRELEQRMPGVAFSDGATIKTVAAELSAIDLDAIGEQTSDEEPEA